MQDMSNLPNNVVDGDGDAVGQDGNPATGAKGTQVLSVWINDFLKNVLYVIQQAGTGLTDGDRTDLYNALLATESTAFLVEHLTAGAHSNINADSINSGGDITVERTSPNEAFSMKIIGESSDRRRINVDGSDSIGDGTMFDITRKRSGVGTYQIASPGATDITKFDVKAVDTDFSGDVNLATGKALYAPDVSGAGAPPASANGGRFLGGNGGFMWFDGVTTGTTAITLNSTIDWRDRHITIHGIIYQSPTPANLLPGGSGDHLLNGSTIDDTSGMDSVRFGSTLFYSESGSTGGGSNPSGLIDVESVASDYKMYIYADSSTGALKLERNVGTGNEAAFVCCVMFSDDQGHV